MAVDVLTWETFSDFGLPLLIVSVIIVYAVWVLFIKPVLGL